MEKALYQTTGLWLGRQQATDECLDIVDRFHSAAGKFDMALKMEIRLSRLPKDSAASYA